MLGFCIGGKIYYLCIQIRLIIMRILGFLIIMGLLSVAFVLLFGFSVLRMLLGAIFGTRPKPRNVSTNQRNTKQTTKQTNNASSIKKIITRDEGEYVDFEEVKD
jgi:disulfide bond formation protein DsbB